MVKHHGLVRDAEEETPMRNVKNQEYKEHGSFNGCGFVTTLVCAIPTTLRLLLESKETKAYYPLWKTLTQTWREGGRSQPSHREH